MIKAQSVPCPPIVKYDTILNFFISNFIKSQKMLAGNESEFYICYDILDGYV